MRIVIILGCVTAGLLLGGWLHRQSRRRGTPVVVTAPVAAGIPEAAGAPKAVGAPVKRSGLGNTGASRFGPPRQNVRLIDLTATRGPGRSGWATRRR